MSLQNKHLIVQAKIKVIQKLDIFDLESISIKYLDRKNELTVIPIFGN